MTEQEKRQADLAAKYEAGTLGTESTDDQKGRHRAAEQWYAHFESVLTLIEDADKDKPMGTKEQIVAALIASWDAKKADADNRMANRIGKLRG